jgi:hypothetical protein
MLQGGNKILLLYRLGVSAQCLLSRNSKQFCQIRTTEAFTRGSFRELCESFVDWRLANQSP